MFRSRVQIPFVPIALVVCGGAARADDSGSFFGDFFKSYTPRATCMHQEQPVIWLHLVSDGLIALAYLTIPIALLTFVRRRRDIEFHWIFVFFAVFILACGLTHVMNVVALWDAMYRFDGVVKAVTAFASVVTAAALWRLLPSAIALPSPRQLRDANAQLEAEVAERREAEVRLVEARNELEDRVALRTRELSLANAELAADVGERKRAAEERERLLESERAARAEAELANTLKDEFLATLSHELRTPLQSILGWSQILAREAHDSRHGAGGSPDLGVGLSTIERNARLQAKLVEDLLDMSRIMSGKLRLDVQHVDLVSVVEGALSTAIPAAEAKGIRIQKVLDPAAGPVRGDPMRLQQVLWNLLSNAVKFTPKGGRIHVTLERVNSHVEIAVTDNGAGIAPEFLPHVFARFRQENSTTTRQHSGLGLGLSIVKSLVELHGGVVTARSEGLGQGSQFRVSLPLSAVIAADPERRHPRAERGEALPPTSIGLQGVRVLVVDDEPDARALIERVLVRAGAEVTTAASPAEGLASVVAHRPHVLLSDIGMPGTDGYEFIRQVRALGADRGGNVAAAAVTAFARTEDRTRALLAGFQSHVVKPLDPDELVAVVASLAKRTG